ncbi:MAG: DUF3810 domain-containing protein [Lewinellaceae bacterium]|nr:DUF3810 domain-containing protein [Lewinellaceae bacterium]
MSNTKTKLAWILMGAATLVLRAVLSGHPEIVESYYSRGVFPILRWLIDYLFAWFPVPLIYPFLIGLIYFLVRKVAGWWRRGYPSLWKKGLDGLLGTAAFLGGGIFFFLVLWGFNYGRQPIEEQMGLELEPLSFSELKEEFNHEAEVIKRLRNQIPGATREPISKDMLPENLENKLRSELENWLSQHGFSTVGRVRGLYVYPKGVFLRFSSSGLYFPFTGEGHVDAGLHPLQKPYVMAHELAHGYGFGDEGTCNFLGYLACIQSEDPLIAYVGHLNYWRTLAADYLQYEPEKYREFRESLPLGIQSDLDAINEVLKRYPDIMPRFRYYAYDAYLKSQGIHEGMKNYDRVIMLARAWRMSQRI